MPHDPNAVRNPDYRVLSILAGLAASYGKTFCWPSQDKILQLLLEQLGRKMSRRTLCRHLKSFERDKHITRIRRHKCGSRGQLVMHSTLYALRKRCFVWLARQRHAAALFASHPLIKLWIDAVPSMAQYRRLNI